VRTIQEIRNDWDFIENSKGPRRKRRRAEERLYLDIPAMLEKIRQLNMAIWVLTEDVDEND